MPKFGAFVPQGWKLELSGMKADEAWATAKAVGLRAEALGYDHLWVYDHVETVPRREPTHVFEAWTMMAALAEITTTARLGQLVTCASYRNAGLLAKQAACVDVMSDGRLIFGIGAGWYHEEYAAYGWPFLPAGQRLRALDETVTVVRQLWTEERVTFRSPGRRHQLADGPRELQAQVEAARAVLRRDRAAVRRDRPHPRPRLSTLRHRGRPEAVARNARRRLAVGPRAARRVRRQQLRGDRRQGHRRRAGLRRRRLPGIRALVPRLSLDREPRALHHRGGPENSISHLVT